MSYPIGSLCVLPDETHTHWLVSICEGNGNRRLLRRFESRGQAAEWAIEERIRRTSSGESVATIQFPDDCPCSANTSTW